MTDALASDSAVLIVRVEAPIDKRFIPHGKQKSLPPDDYNDCAFTASSGFWQPVWLEARPATYIETAALAPTEALDGIDVHIRVAGPARDAAELQLSIDGGAPTTIAVDGRTDIRLICPVAAPELWSPDHPRLYNVALRLTSDDGEDAVVTYTGLRKVEIRDRHLFLNGERLYLRGALDQGFWPGTGYTAPSDDALRHDVELALAAGFNLVRKHIKLEDPRWLYWADRLGLLVWEEPACFGRYRADAAALFEAQLEPMVMRDGNHPSTVIWGLYNEEWGLDWRCAEEPELQQAVERAYDLLKAVDAGRPIVDNSGWWHVKTDLVDWHYYDEDMASWKKTTAALASDQQAWFWHRLADARHYETQLSVAGRDHSDRPLINGEYGGGRASNQGWLFRWQTQDMRLYDAFDGYIYTELYDVEYEKVGMYDAQRRMKELACQPSDVNAETLVIFDLVPVRPGADVVTGDGTVELMIRVSHHGSLALEAALHWGWQPQEATAKGIALRVEPFEITSAIRITEQLPDQLKSAKLHVWLTDSNGIRVAYNYLDVVTTT